MIKIKICWEGVFWGHLLDLGEFLKQIMKLFTGLQPYLSEEEFSGTHVKLSYWISSSLRWQSLTKLSTIHIFLEIKIEQKDIFISLIFYLDAVSQMANTINDISCDLFEVITIAHILKEIAVHLNTLVTFLSFLLTYKLIDPWAPKYFLAH